MSARYLKYGSKASSMDIPAPGDDTTSYPPSPYLPASPTTLTKKLIKSYTSDSSDDDLNYSLPVASLPPTLNLSADEEDEVFPFEQQKGFPNFKSLEDEESGEEDYVQAPAGASVPPATRNPEPTESRRFSEDSSSSDKSRFQLRRQFSMDADSNEDEMT